MTTTTESVGEAQDIADQLVEQRLAACVQITGPITSTYRWEGEVNSSQEFMCFIKTRRELTNRVEALVRSLHSYENPEIIVMPIQGGSPAYLDWIAAETSGEGA